MPDGMIFPASDLAHFERSHGIVLRPYGVRDFLPPSVAMDAQPQLVTTNNAGIPAFLSTYIDPEVIRVLITPNQATDILGERKVGDWVTTTAMFPMVESLGEVSSYGDWNNNGSVNVNTQFPTRQSYYYQTITQWGERQLEMAGLGKIDLASEINLASVIVLDKFQTNSYFFGIQGLECYGLLNDPYLSASLTPITKAAGGTGWPLATANEVFTDVQSLFKQLVVQTRGLVNKSTPMKLCISPGSEVYLTNTNSFGISVSDLLQKNFPNIRVVTAIQYSGLVQTSGLEFAQLWVDGNIEGRQVGYCAFTEKLRAHPVILDLSAFKQKKSQGTWGAIIKLPIAVASMSGI